MYIKSLSINNFRNYEEARIDFSKNINIIYGKNAQGKTNILEALYLCATSKSQRTTNCREMIKFDSDEAHINVNFIKNNMDDQIDIHLRKNNKKSISLNKIPIKKLSELFGIIQIVIFSPEDLGLIKNGPKERRRFIDIELCQINPLYYYNLKNYYQVLKQRNNLLKDIKKNNYGFDQLDVWDIQLLNYGLKVMKFREEFINELNPYFIDNHYQISGQKEKSSLFYEKNIFEKTFEEKLLKNRNYDIMTGSTSVGPHKDDIRFEINNVDIRKFGSQGQQRTAALSLKLSEIKLMEKNSGESPILLLDDVLSELDDIRQNYLIHHIKDIQTIITCTGIEDFIKSNVKIDHLIKVENGKIIL